MFTGGEKCFLLEKKGEKNESPRIVGFSDCSKAHIIIIIIIIIISSITFIIIKKIQSNLL